MYQLVRNSLLVITTCLLTACAGQPAAKFRPVMVDALDLPAAAPALDHYIALIPLELAQTATVAEAMTHISLRNARDQLGNELCDGSRISGGAVVERLGPVAVRTPASMGGYPVWYYRISKQPGLNGCETEHTTILYQGLRTRLPDWITIRAGELAGNRAVALEITP